MSLSEEGRAEQSNQMVNELAELSSIALTTIVRADKKRRNEIADMLAWLNADSKNSTLGYPGPGWNRNPDKKTNE
jgi:hypothetical protein